MQNLFMKVFRGILAIFILMGALVVVTPTPWVEAATGRISNLLATTTEVGGFKMLDVILRDASGNAIGASTMSEVTHDAAALTWSSVVGDVAMGRASAAAPTDVTADNEPVAPWFFRNGARASASVAATAGGCTPGSILSAASVNETEIKASTGQLYMVTVSNNNIAARYIKFYNSTAADTDETDTPVWRYMIPPSNGGFVIPLPVGASFSTAITFRMTTGAADNDTGAVSANEHMVSYCYK